MNTARKTIAGAVLLLAAGGLSSSAAAKAKGNPPANVPTAEVKWEPYAPGVPLQVGQIWGDRNKGDHGMFLKLPAGFEAGMHSHTADYYGILVQGTWFHTNEGDTSAPKELTPGSYVFQPGKQIHNDVCKGKTDCIIFVYQKAKGDFIPAKAPAAADKAAAPAEKAAPAAKAPAAAAPAAAQAKTAEKK